MDPLVYKLLHLAGVMAVFMGLGISLLPETAFRKQGGLLHGIGLLVILVAGFGLIAKLKYGFPLWVILKLVIWLALGVLPVLGKKKVLPIAAIWALALVLGVGAAYLGIYKPFA